jgi:hypothetical protein
LNHGIEVEEDECKQEDLGEMEAALSFRSVPGVDAGGVALLM